ncbi:MAG: Hpt domain-containing protein [Bacteroidales bacterium]|nr:Hpt domain-containing protein [Bacteroidales bacterium]
MSNTYKYINLDYLFELTEGSQEFIDEMINIFINQVPEFIVELKTLYNNKDYTELSKAAHKAKSSVSIVGMNQLADNLKTLEMLAKEGISPERYKDIIDSFEFNCNSACEELKYYLQTVENR